MLGGRVLLAAVYLLYLCEQDKLPYRSRVFEHFRAGISSALQMSVWICMSWLQCSIGVTLLDNFFLELFGLKVTKAYGELTECGGISANISGRVGYEWNRGDLT